VPKKTDFEFLAVY